MTRQRASELQNRDGFPEPIVRLASGPIWKKDSLERFAASWPRRSGRPRKMTAPEEPGFAQPADA